MLHTAQGTHGLRQNLYFCDMAQETKTSPSAKTEVLIDAEHQIILFNDEVNTFDHVIKTLRKLDRPVTIEGHTDSMKPAGKLDNLSLSSVRAANILTYMMQEHSFPVSLLSIAGYGELKPVASNGSSVGRALNRRIEFHVEYDDDDRTL